MPENDLDPHIRRFTNRAVVSGVACGAVLLMLLGWGLIAAAQGGLKGVGGYVQNALLAVIAIIAGIIVNILMKQSSDFDEAMKEQRRRDDLVSTAQSAVNRLVSIGASIGEVLSNTTEVDTCPAPELRTRMRVITAISQLALGHADGALRDWRRLSPDVVDSEIAAARQSFEDSAQGPSNEGDDAT